MIIGPIEKIIAMNFDKVAFSCYNYADRLYNSLDESILLVNLIIIALKRLRALLNCCRVFMPRGVAARGIR